MPAYFRFLTIMAFHVFLQEKVSGGGLQLMTEMSRWWGPQRGGIWVRICVDQAVVAVNRMLCQVDDAPTNRGVLRCGFGGAGGRDLSPPTSLNPWGHFLLMALMSLRPQVDLAVVEVGIGGTYDCTNIIR